MDWAWAWPTTDPAAFFTGDPLGFLLPFGGHKGGGLQVLCELLGGALAGHWTTQPLSDRDYGATVNNMLSIIINPDAFGERAAYEAEAEAMIDYIRGAAPAEGFDRVQMPGDPERASMARRLREGVPVDDNTWGELAQAASALGIDAAGFAAD